METAGRPAFPSGVLTFLFTDIEESATLWDAHRAARAGALARHDELVEHHVVAGGGTLVKSKGEGDATLSVFRRASDAVAAALELQDALGREHWPEGMTLRARMALHTGEADERDGDYYGPVLNRAARLRSLARGGQVLVSQATAELVRDHLPSRTSLVGLGRRQLRGLQRDESVYSLEVATTRRQGARADLLVLELPPGLAAPEGSTFVGRDAELARLAHLWEQARAGNRRAVLVAGEPGIGKTHLVGEAARRAHADGGVVLYGRCDEEMLVPYQPFVEALRAYVVQCPVVRLRDQLQGLGGELGRVMPQLLGRLRDLPPPVEGEPDTERYRLFEAVTTLVAGIAVAQPVMLALDDLQWADKPTLLLFRYLLRSASGGALLVVGAYRDVELDAEDPLSELLADLRREHLTERLTVPSLGEPDVGELLSAVSGSDVPADLTRELYRATEGNPFFLEELLRHLSETGALMERGGQWATTLSLEELGIPEGVREVVARRLLRLSADATHVLSLASVAGTEFSLEVVAGASDLDADRVLEVVEEAGRARLVDEVPDTPGRFAFSHVLVRETLYQGLATARRSRLHCRIGESLERLRSARPEPDLAELARHFSEAARAGEATAERAFDYCRRAGDHAMTLLAYEEAAGHYEHALEALERVSAPDDSGRGEVLLGLGDAYWRAGERDRSRDSIMRAVDLARARTDPELLGAAVLLLGTGQSSREGFDISMTTTPANIALLEEALGALTEHDSALRARLLGRLAVQTYWSEPRTRREELSREAVAMAERTGDDGALLGTLVSRRYALWDPDGTEERLATADQILQLAEQYGRADRALEARLFRIIDLMELSDVSAAVSEIATFRATAARERQPYLLWYAAALEVMQLLLNGRFDDAEPLAQHALVLGERAQDPAALTAYGAQMMQVWIEQGRIEELERAYEVIHDFAGDAVTGQAGLVWIAMELGRIDEARNGFERLAVGDFYALPRDTAWLAAMTGLVITCAALEDAKRAAVLYRLLAPYEGRNVMVWAFACLGPVDRSLGVLAATMGRHEAAASHFEDALRMSEALGARCLSAHTQADLAQTVLARGGSGDRARALALLEPALATAHDHGMKPLVDQAERTVRAARGDE